MRLPKTNKAVSITLPQRDLLVLLLLPEFQNLLSRFSESVRIQMHFEPCSLHIHWRSIPFFLDTTDQSGPMVRLRETLKRLYH